MKTDLWSPSMIFTNVKTPPKAKKLKKTPRKQPKMPKKAKKRKKCFFSANSPRNILIFWETANFYVLLKEQSKPGKLHTLGVEFALGEVCGNG